MDQLPEEAIQGVHRVLRNLTSPMKLAGSPWFSSCLVEQQLQENSALTQHQALKKVFTEVRDTLEGESAVLADILRGRFWEEREVKRMLTDDRPEPMSERTFNNRQKEAIQRFAYLLLERERICKQTHEIAVPPETEREPLPLADTEPDAVLPLPSPEPSAPPTENRRRLGAWISIHRSRVIVVIVLLAMVLIAVLTAAQGLRLVGSFTPTPAIPGASSTNSPPSPAIASVCGEVGRVQAPNQDRFVRSQGVSAFTVSNTKRALLNDRVRAVAVDPRGLWIGYFATPQNLANGLSHYDKNSWASCNQVQGTAGKNVNSIAFNQTGRVWVALEKAGVAVFDGKSWITYTTNDGLPSNDVFEITVDKDGDIWVGTWEGVAKFSGKVWTVPYTDQNSTLYDKHVHVIAFDTTGNIWVGHSDQGISQFRSSDGKWVHHTAQAKGLGGNKIRGIVIRPALGASPESVWVATADGGVSRYEQGKWTPYLIKDGLPNNDVEAVAIDKHRRVWAATAGGVAYFDGTTWITYNTINTLSIAFGPHCQNCPFDDDHVWTGTLDSGLTHSRVPYPDQAVDIKDVKYPNVVAPGQKFSPEITIVPRAPYQLREDRGDFLAVTNDEDIALFGVYRHIGVTGVVESGQPYKFVDTHQPITAPQLAPNEQEKTFTLTYRLWMYTRYAGPPIRITFTVRRPGAAATPVK